MVPRSPYIFWAFISGARADDDDGLSDFSNDLATDLAPLLVLFGDAMTKQYLSESTYFLDYLIFAMGPIGILTAMVSTIRVCGHSSLRAFIGKSQESEGTIEAELCSSTNRDVCELFNRGGIARVLGRPNVLELVYTPQEGTEGPRSLIDPDDFTLDLSRDYFVRASEFGSSTGWKRIKGTVLERSTKEQVLAEELAPSPNLSLNVGIFKRAKWVSIAISVVGIFLQTGVLALAGVGVWFLGWNLKGGRTPASKNYAPVMFICWNSSHVPRHVELRIPHRPDPRKRSAFDGVILTRRIPPQKTRLPLLLEPGLPPPKARQLPGPQVIGDQSFDPFGYVEDPANPVQVWTSSRKEFNDAFELRTYFAVLAVLIGYVAQFIGLRGMKAWVSLAQLGVCVTMSILRGCLRMNRLGKGSNQLADRLDIVSGYELDWLSRQMVPQELEWTMNTRCAKRFRSSRRTRTHRTQGSGDDSSSYEYRPPQASMNSRPMEGDEFSLHRLVAIRKRLARLTGQASSYEVLASGCQRWKDESVKVRSKARQVSAAICQVAEKHLPKSARLQRLERGRISIPMVAYNKHMDEHRRTELGVNLHLSLEGGRPVWKLDPVEVEALLGLWMWESVDDSLLNDDCLASRERLDLIPVSRIVSLTPNHENSDDDAANIHTEMSFWSLSSLNLSQQHLRLEGQPWYSVKSLWAATIERPSIDMHFYRVQPGVTPGATPGVPLGRYCGWNAVQGDLQPGYRGVFRAVISQLGSNEGSLLNVVSQDFLTTLLVSLSRYMTIDQTKVVVKGGRAHLENPTVNDLVDAFSENGLGSRETALLCIIPALRERLLLSAPQDLLDAIINTRWESLRSPDPIRCLKWNCALFSPLDGKERRVFAQALRAVGEFYRTSFRNSRLGIKSYPFVSDGLVVWMHRTYSGRAQGDPVVKEILECYWAIAQKLAHIPRMKAYTMQGENEKKEAHSKLLEALKDGDRTETLYRLCLVGAEAFRSDTLQPALPLAVRNDWTEVAKDILDLQADLSSRDENGRSAVSYAAELGFQHHLKTLNERGANLDQPDDKQRTPLYYASDNGHKGIVKLLVSHGTVDIHRTDKEGHNALWAASRRGHKAIMEDLLKRGVSPDCRKGEYEQAPFFLASSHGYTAVALDMVDRMSKWEDAETGRELLAVAETRGYTELIDKLRGKVTNFS
ncbi:hypothetical protein MRS44_005656 [Fusarium solani]|uniref:uncharacterized protein n=1 Tax=Fusarium solani TaxID=169388 RepID=UPI0032C4A0D7|nr:hypothetical protein MRS44_005656 [Fusarium solani]